MKTYISGAWIGSDIIADAIADATLDVVFSEHATEMQSCIFSQETSFYKVSLAVCLIIQSSHVYFYWYFNDWVCIFYILIPWIQRKFVSSVWEMLKEIARSEIKILQSYINLPFIIVCNFRTVNILIIKAEIEILLKFTWD